MVMKDSLYIDSSSAAALPRIVLDSQPSIINNSCNNSYSKTFLNGIKVETSGVKLMGDDRCVFNGDPSSQVGNLIGNRFFIDRKLGKGSFGQVFKVTDLQSHLEFAIKFLDSQKYMHSVKAEISTLKFLKEFDHDNLFLKYMTDFTMGRFHCIVFELLGENLYDILKANSFHGLPLDEVFGISFQLLQAINKLYDLKIIHCDIKPENIATVNNQKPIRIKLIDFGSSCMERSVIFHYVQSRFYRALEVMLDTGYNCMVDVWSVGCVIAELITGMPLFPGTSELDQLHYFTYALGPIPQMFAENSPKFNNFFVRNCNQVLLKAPQSYCHTYPLLYLAYNSQSVREYLKHFPESRRQVDSLLEMVTMMLHYDPNIRATPQFSLQHLIFSGDYSRDSLVGNTHIEPASISIQQIHPSHQPFFVHYNPQIYNPPPNLPNPVPVYQPQPQQATAQRMMQNGHALLHNQSSLVACGVMESQLAHQYSFNNISYSLQPPSNLQQFNQQTNPTINYINVAGAMLDTTVMNMPPQPQPLPQLIQYLPPNPTNCNCQQCMSVRVQRHPNFFPQIQ